MDLPTSSTITLRPCHRPLQECPGALEQAGFAIERIREIPDDEDLPQCGVAAALAGAPLHLDLLGLIVA